MAVRCPLRFSPRRLVWTAFYPALGLLLPVLNAQEDPSRFLLVKKWVGTFTHTLTNSGSGGNCGSCTLVGWNYSHSVEVTTQLLPDPELADHPYLRAWESGTNDSERATIDDRLTIKCSPQSQELTEYSARAANPITDDSFLLSIRTETGDDLDRNSYILALPYILTEVTHKLGPLTIGPFPGAMCWILTTNAPLTYMPLPATGLVLSGSAKVRMRDWLCASFACPDLAAAPPAYLDADLVVTWNIVPAEAEELEVVVDAVGYDLDGNILQYDAWQPQGNLDDWREPGNDLTIQARLQTKDGGTPSNKAEQFTFSLLDVSREPGVCMNYPTKNLADREPDLRFQQFLNSAPLAPHLVWIDQFTVETLPKDGGHTEAETILSSYDFGGYAKLKVTADVAGRKIEGYSKSDPSKTPGEILLPKRTAQSHIADKWKEANSVSSVPDNDDAEDDPPGDDHKGDGLTLYEEYRGFSQNLKHLRSNPKKKDLFVADTINNPRSKTGIHLFKVQSGLEVHHEFKPDELSSRADIIDRWINFNVSTNTPHVVQHGLLIKKIFASKGEAVRAPGFAFPSTPASAAVILISSDISALWQPGDHIAGTSEIKRNGKTIVTDDMVALVAHELAHGCSVWHHGDCDEREKSWSVKLTGTNLIVFEDGQEVVLRGEKSSWVIALPPCLPQTNNLLLCRVWLGMPNGEHSGFENCFMRYAAADGYPWADSDLRFWVRGDELTGIRLCQSPVGTGVNDKNRTPQPRYGDAAPGRGNCKAQICVNDLYVRHTTHIRTNYTCSP